MVSIFICICQALNCADLYTFGEILEITLKLKHSEDAEEKRCYNLLSLFCFGTYSQYVQNKQLYGSLTEVQLRKLRQLSIVSMSYKNKQLQYDDLKEELQMYDLRELEDLVLDTMYQGLIGGKLDSKKEILYVEFAIGRDLRDDDLEELARVLSQWQMKAETVCKSIEIQLNEARGRIQNDEMERGMFEERVKEVTERLAKKLTMKGNEGGGGGGGGRRYDDERGGGGGGNRRRDFKGGGRKRGMGGGDIGFY